MFRILKILTVVISLFLGCKNEKNPDVPDNAINPSVIDPLVVLAAHRTRQLMKGSHALVHSKNKPAVTALREIAAGKVHFDRSSHEAVQEWIEVIGRTTVL